MNKEKEIIRKQIKGAANNRDSEIIGVEDIRELRGEIALLRQEIRKLRGNQ